MGRLRMVGLQGADCAYAYLFDPQASWESIVTKGRSPEEIAGAVLEIRGLSPGAYRVQHWDIRETVTVTVLEGRRVAADGTLRLPVPEFRGRCALRVEPQP